MEQARPYRGKNGRPSVAELFCRLLQQAIHFALAQLSRLQACSALGIKNYQNTRKALTRSNNIRCYSIREAKHKDIVLADTAGRHHININLMDQLRKVWQVEQSWLIIFVMRQLLVMMQLSGAKAIHSVWPLAAAYWQSWCKIQKAVAAISISYTTGSQYFSWGRTDL